jgi:class 3 adenylate cyclase/tetratricopeptide (TPR) repeat protein
VSICPSCSHENQTGAKFCSECGVSLGEAVSTAEEMRKTVTVLFCDVVGFTTLGEHSDPEPVRQLMGRYFAEMRKIVERHGGMVEKFIGDAVMAVFGVPQSHEDDALRAVRAAAEMQAAVAPLKLEIGIGVNTGEVVTGAGETFATGDAVNVAARLEQATSPGEILIGTETFELVRDAVTVEAIDPLELKGKEERVGAHRLIAVAPEAPSVMRHLDPPMVGRQRELDRLRADFEHSVSESACHLFTLLGPAGVGKSRLVRAFVEDVAHRARVLRGRCLPYGEGITYWPLVEVLMQLSIEPESLIKGSPAEIQLALRKLLESEAGGRPVVVYLDDLQWAEPTFLDLVEHVADWSRDAPIFLLCAARPELLDLRPRWGGGKLNAASLLLEPLSLDEGELLIDNLVANTGFDDRLRRRIVEAAEGNPLFVEEMTAVAREEGASGDLTVPPSIHALLQARLDRLSDGERAVIGRGAVEGKVFHRAVVEELAPDDVRPQVETHLLTLVRRELIRSEPPLLAGDDAYRFRHLLIRDAAYDTLPKATRVDLHGRFATWLDEHADLVEQDEIVGYHLEQAARYGEELGEPNAVLAERAAKRLGSAGQTALNRGDFRAGRTFLRRAIDVLPEQHPRRFDLLPPYLFALLASGARQDAPPALDDLRTSDDPTARAYAEVFGAELALLDAKEGSVGLMEEAAVAARPFFAKAGDELGLAYSERTRGLALWARCRASEALEAFEQAQAHAETAGQWNLADDCITAITLALVESKPIEEASVRCLELLESTRGRVLAEAAVSVALVNLRAIGGEVEEARQLLSVANATTRETAYPILALSSAFATVSVEQAANDVVAEERAFRQGLIELERLGDQSYQATLESFLAEFLVRNSRDQEAEDVLHSARERSTPGDVVNIAVLDGVEALLLARRGEHEKAERLVRAAVALAETTDFYWTRAVAGERLAAVLELAGKGDEARDEFLRTVGIYEEKGAVVSAARVRGQFATLAGPASR